MKKLKLIINVLLITAGLAAAAAVTGCDRAVSAEPAQTETVTESETEPTTQEPTTEQTTVSPEEAAELFYKDTVFIGDSITDGFRIYASRNDSAAYLKNLQFFACVNFGVNYAMQGAAKAKVYPLYKGQKMNVEDVMRDIYPSRIFISLGMNEVAGHDAMVFTTRRYSQLVYRLKEACPDAKIYIMSVTYMTKTAQRPGYYTNDDIKNFNNNVKQYEDAWGFKYVDLASYVADEEGNISPAIVGDNNVHFNNDGYKLWEKFFAEFAANEVNAGDYEVVKRPRPEPPKTERSKPNTVASGAALQKK